MALTNCYRRRRPESVENGGATKGSAVTPCLEVLSLPPAGLFFLFVGGHAPMFAPVAMTAQDAYNKIYQRCDGFREANYEQLYPV